MKTPSTPDDEPERLQALRDRAAAGDMTSYSAQQLALALAQSSEARSRTQSILASANYIIIESAPDGVIREFNAAAERMLGYVAEEVVGKRTPAFLHDPAEVVARSQELSRELGVVIQPGFETFVAKPRRGIPAEGEWTFLRKDGSRFPGHLSVTACLSAAGEVMGFVGIAADISARKSAEAQLRESELLLRTVFASMAEGVTIQDRHGTVQEGNAAAERILGLSRAQLLGSESVDPRWRCTHLDGSVFPGETHPPMVTLRTGLPQNDVPMVIQRPNGERVLVSINTRPIGVSGDGKSPEAVVSTFRDITRQAQVEEALRDSEARSRAVVETALDAFLIIDEHGLIDRANSAVQKLFGYTPAELVGQNVKTLMPSPDHERHDGYLATYAATGERKVIGIGREVTARRKDGTTFPADLSVSEFFLDGKRCFSGMVRDISDRKRVERLQSEFVSTVSHELRTPLTSIRGSLGLIAGGVLGELPKEAKEYLDIALANSERLVRLINDILDLERMQIERMAFRLVPTEIGAAIRAAVAANEGFATAHRVHLRGLEDAPAGSVLVDPDRLAQALTNLISNAVKFSAPEGTVEITLERAEGAYRVCIRDHGPGIAKEFESRIFERFAQADASTTRTKGGSGLGLSITRAIIEQMHGSIGFRAGEGGGTVFFFELPELPTSVAVEAPTGSAKVLVCEDDLQLARALRRLLIAAGYQVDLAGTLESARRLLSEGTYDAIALDVALADGDGRELVAELRAAERTRDIPIVIVSGLQGELGAVTAHVSDVLLKPFSGPSLLQAIEAAMANTKRAVPRVLHVEGDADIRRIVRRTLPQSWQVLGADSLQAARSALAESDFEVVLLELSLPDGRGEELFELVGKAQIIIFSAQEASAQLAPQISAFLVKSRSNPVEVRETLLSLLHRATARRRVPP